MARKTQIPPKSFEEALQELEQILTGIENGQVGLEESLLKYERGNFLIQHCRGILNAAERQVELLSRSPDGGLTATPAEAGQPAAEQPDDAE
jgi:exodeoxyribonuclease VII small subunit